MPHFTAPTPLIPDLITQNGRWIAESAALVDGETTLSWSEFARRTALMANALVALGVRPRERIAVLMDSRYETVLTLFGILRAGACAVPLNVSVNEEAVAAMCADAECVAVFASGAHCHRIQALRSAGRLRARHYIGCEAAPADWLDFNDLLTGQPDTAPRVPIAPDDECNLIYSSGTTALPKGIVHTHACRMHWAYDAALALRYRAGCRTLCSLGLYSNISWVSMLATMLVGGTIVLLRRFDPLAALSIIERERITHGALVPVQLERMLAEPDRAQFRTGTLETLMCCGSPLKLSTKRAIPRELGCRFIELYGLTEGLFTILQPEHLDSKPDSVGKPLFGSDIRILGDDDREVPRGQVGEIVGRSRLVMDRYHRREDANLEVTWLDEHGEQWLRTGDLGRVDEDGFLYIVDRKKDMILSGGQNIYPADIENVLRGHPSVEDVAVVGMASEQWGETPLAVVVRRTGHDVTRESLLAWINARVGRQQRVAEVVWRESLPRNPNGKVLKRELRLEQASRAEHRSETVSDSPTDYFYQSADGLPLYCRIYGAARPGGAPVVCLPGITRNSRDFAELAAHLRDRHEVLTPDLRGRGRSAWDPDPTHYQPGTYVQDVWKLLDSRNVSRVIVIGTSLGALMGMIMAATAPARVAGVVLNDAGPEIDPVGLKRIAAYVGQLPPVSTWAEAAAQAMRVYGSALPGLTDADWLDYARRAYREKDGIPVPDLDPNIAQAFKNPPPVSSDLWPVYEKITGVPLLVIRGAHSDILAEHTVARMVRDKPDVQHITVPNRGHAPLLNEPECLTAIDAFLSRYGTLAATA